MYIHISVQLTNQVICWTSHSEAWLHAVNTHLCPLSWRVKVRVLIIAVQNGDSKGGRASQNRRTCKSITPLYYKGLLRVVVPVKTGEPAKA